MDDRLRCARSKSGWASACRSIVSTAARRRAVVRDRAAQSADAPEESQKAIETLLLHHHHSRTGLALVPQGTPTNNTEQASAGFDRADDAEASFDMVVRRLRPRLPDQDRWADKQDGQWLAEALGLDPAVFATVPGARGTDQLEARAANVALWPATWGYFLETMLHPVLADRTDRVRARVLHEVRERPRPGAAPSASAGSRTGFCRRRCCRGCRPSAGDDRLLDTRFLKNLFTLLSKVAEAWEPLAAAVPHVGTAGDPHQTLLDIAGAASRRRSNSTSATRRASRTCSTGSAFDNLGRRLLNALQAVIAIARARDLLADLGWGGADPDILEKVFHGTQHKLKGPLIDDRPLSETEPVRAYTRRRPQLPALAGGCRTHVARRAAPGAGLHRRTASRRPCSTCCCGTACCSSWWDASLRFRHEAGILNDDELQLARRERAFVHVGAAGATSESRFRALYSPEPAVTGDPRSLVAEVIPARLFERPARHLADTIDAIAGA